MCVSLSLASATISPGPASATVVCVLPFILNKCGVRSFTPPVAFVALFAQFRGHVRLRRRAQVQNLRETRFLTERQFKRNAVLPKRDTDLLDATKKVAVLLVELIDEHEAWFLHFVQHLPDAAG